VDLRTGRVLLHRPDPWTAAERDSSGHAAAAVALAPVFGHLPNPVLAPPLVGLLSGWFRSSLGAGRESLRWALLLLAPTGFWAAWHLWTSGVTIREDELRAS